MRTRAGADGGCGFPRAGVRDRDRKDKLPIVKAVLDLHGKRDCLLKGKLCGYKKKKNLTKQNVN